MTNRSRFDAAVARSAERILEHLAKHATASGRELRAACYADYYTFAAALRTLAANRRIAHVTRSPLSPWKLAPSCQPETQCQPETPESETRQETPETTPMKPTESESALTRLAVAAERIAAALEMLVTGEYGAKDIVYSIDSLSEAIDFNSRNE